MLTEQVADELYPETMEKEDDDNDDVTMEEMLEKELAGLKDKDEKSKRFSESRWDA